MAQITLARAISVLQVVGGALRQGHTIDANALDAVNAGLYGMYRSGLEPTDAQVAALDAAISTLAEASATADAPIAGVEAPVVPVVPVGTLLVGVEAPVVPPVAPPEAPVTSAT